MIRERRPPAFLVAFLCAQTAFASQAYAGPQAPKNVAPKVVHDDAAIVHALSRLTFGPRPGDVARVKAIGLSAWIDQQTNPQAPAGVDRALEARLAPFETLRMPTAELREKYEVPLDVRLRIQRDRADRTAAAEKEGATPPAAIEDMSPMERRAEREELAKKFPELSRMSGPPLQVLTELQAAKVLRATYAERQLDELMADFWFNHFNVFARKGPIEYMVGEYERTIRAHAMGRFEDLLVATAKSPAMLFYLDNWQSTDPKFNPRAEARRRRMMERGQGTRRRNDPGMQTEMPSTPAPARTFGLNENYARELMELHTLGVDGGYTQTDVVEVAKALTGWTIVGEGPAGPLRSRDSKFSFEDARHVKGDKKVLGVTIKEGGVKEGLEILRMLAAHPKTATFLSTKLIRRFVTDTPPAAYVDRVAAVFTKTKGDIRATVRAVVTDEEFFSPKWRGAKVKTPFEFVVSSLRATGAEVANPRELSRLIAGMGMPLYLQQPPTGYKDTAEEWVSTAALLERMNFALDLSAGRVRGVRLDASSVGRGTIDDVAGRLLPSGLSETSKETLDAEARREGGEPARLVGLVLGSPEFQRR